MFSTLPETNFNYSVTLNLSSANAFNLNQSKNLTLGKELNKIIKSFLKTLEQKNHNLTYFFHNLYYSFSSGPFSVNLFKNLDSWGRLKLTKPACKSTYLEILTVGVDYN